MPEWIPWPHLAEAGYVLGWTIVGSFSAVLFIWKLLGGLLKANGNNNGNGNGVTKRVLDDHDKRLDRIEKYLLFRPRDDE